MIVTIASFKGGVGKTTTALHLAAYLQQNAPTLLVDGDLNRSALDWSHRGNLPFKVVDEKQAVKFGRQFEHIVIDTPARPAPEDLKTLAEGCDLLVLPTSPDALAMGAMLQMLEVLQTLETDYRILLTIIPPKPNLAGEEARMSLESAELPVFKGGIRRLNVFQKAALEGVPVYAVIRRDCLALLPRSWGGSFSMSRFDQLIGTVGKRKTPDSPEVEEPSPQTKPLTSSSKAKGKDPNYQRTTFYIPKDIHREFKMAALEDGVEMSDIVEDLISQWLRERQP